MKFVRFKELGFILFPEEVIHADISDTIGKYYVVSSGFVTFTNGLLVSCYGYGSVGKMADEKKDTADLQIQLGKE